jgi:hypothetical protein
MRTITGPAHEEPAHIWRLIRDEETLMEARTSLTHTLRISAVDAPAGGGRIGMTLFPGRRDGLSAVAPWMRDLTLDLEVVRAWHPAIVFTLVEDFEFALLGVPEFGDAMRSLARAERLEWFHLPIRDGGVPDAAFETAWLASGLAARTVLRAGGRVLLHCRAGLGRTGTIAARLLVELGVPPGDAINSIRRAREQTIETKAQERHVRAQRAIVDRPPGAR